MTVALVLLVAAGAAGVVLLVSHMRGTHHVARLGWPAHAAAAVAGFVAFTVALTREGTENGWVLVAYMLVIAALILGVIVAATKEDQRVPIRVLLLHASVGAAAIGLLVAATG